LNLTERLRTTDVEFTLRVPGLITVELLLFIVSQ